MSRISRRGLAAMIALLALTPTCAPAAEAVSEIRVDWATYNPVSLILKQKGMLEKEFAKDGIRIVWVQSAGSNKALEYLNAGSIDFGSTAGSAALVARINGNRLISDLRELAPKIAAPTLVVCGDDDIPSFRDAARWLASRSTVHTRGSSLPWWMSEPFSIIHRAMASRVWLGGTWQVATHVRGGSLCAPSEARLPSPSSCCAGFCARSA